MSNQPPIPEASQSPYPLEGPQPESEALAMVREMAEARKRWSRTQLGVGAAIGVGSAAIVAGLLYWRGNNRK
jgi:hypothetical protein